MTSAEEVAGAELSRLTTMLPSSSVKSIARLPTTDSVGALDAVAKAGAVGSCTVDLGAAVARTGKIAVANTGEAAVEEETAEDAAVRTFAGGRPAATRASSRLWNSRTLVRLRLALGGRLCDDDEEASSDDEGENRALWRGLLDEEEEEEDEDEWDVLT